MTSSLVRALWVTFWHSVRLRDFPIATCAVVTACQWQLVLTLPRSHPSPVRRARSVRRSGGDGGAEPPVMGVSGGTPGA